LGGREKKKEKEKEKKRLEMLSNFASSVSG
jgi:hypothetical protein